MDKHTVRSELLYGRSPSLKRRRAVIVISLLGAAGMALGAMRQTGIVKRLPDPPGKSWDANKVTTSDDAYPFGIPDAPFALTSLAANVAIASIGGEERPRGVSILAAGKGLVDACVGLWYLYRMVTKEKVLCAYCLFSNVALMTIAALTADEALQALNK